MNLLIKDFSVSAGNKQIINRLSLSVSSGEVHVLMGPNGSGKSSLSLALLGHPEYQITNGSVILDKKDITNSSPEQKSSLGLFLSFQKPVAIPGVCYLNLLRNAYLNKFKAKNNSNNIRDFLKILKEKAKVFHVSEELVKKEVNFGMSGGEQKKMEILTLSLLTPHFAILDEVDTGLDVDALKVISRGLSVLKKEMGILLITHNVRVLKYLKPDFVHIMINGKIVKSGDFKLAKEVEKEGFRKFNFQ